MRRGSILQLILIGVGAGAIATAVAIFVPWLPTPASRQAGRIDFVYWFATVISLFIFAVVAAILIYAVINFRVKDPMDFSDGPPVHGHTTIEIIWTVVPAILVTAISVVSAIVLAQNSHAGSNPLVVRVFGQQFTWTFQYPNGKIFPILRLPIDRGVELEVTAKDVIHSFWVPQFGQKQDAVPGQVNSLVITPDRLGTYPVICTELCGLGHALMRSEAIVMKKADWNSWYRGTSQPAPQPSGGAGVSAGAAIFTQYGCVACHTFTPIPAATGKVGPSLDNLKASAAKAGQQLQDFIKQSIVDPNAYIAPGYQPNVMPQTFGSTIPRNQLDLLVEYLAQNTK
ncbi:MAG TPA: cytochrome c oxidase subunit II [Gaiellaceae bacterium]|nr:cytochrome c oxidase subunit II [Gaiellaceae bacterium]